VGLVCPGLFYITNLAYKLRMVFKTGGIIMPQFIKKILYNIKSLTGEYKNLIKNRRLMTLILAGIISSFGSKISYFALLRQVYVISDGEILSLGFLTIVQTIPSIAFGAFAGIIIDRLPRKWIMIVSDITNGLLTLGVIFANNLTLIYVLGFLKATVYVFRNPAQGAFEPNLIAKEDIPLLHSFKSSTNSLIQIVGSATGAAVVGFMGIRNAFVIDALTFWVSASLLITIIIKETHGLRTKEGKDNKKYLKEFTEGISIMWENSYIKLMIIIELFLTFAMAMQGTLIYFFIQQTLKMGDKAELAWGTLLSGLGVGTIIGSFVLGVKVKRHPNKFKLFLNVLLFDAFTFMLFALNTYFPLSFVLFTFLGAVSAASNIILHSVIQETVPDHNRGKVYSVISMLVGPIAILSNLVGTTGAKFITAQGVLLICAGLEAMIAIGVRFTRAFREVDQQNQLVTAVIKEVV
jgi:MFS transporter, DHA3 family, macrolide efflux protein